ncbi:hypothetical protein GCM10028818_18590 [Spirosoma horti]
MHQGGTQTSQSGMLIFRSSPQPAPIVFLYIHFGLLFLTQITLAQRSEKFDPSVYTIVEKQPQFPGGMTALDKYMKTNVNYPSAAEQAGVKGKVYVSFIVEPDGNRTDITVLEGLGYGCDEEAIRVIRTMPLWEPGGQSGHPLRVKYKLPILFGVDYPKRKGH